MRASSSSQGSSCSNQDGGLGARCSKVHPAICGMHFLFASGERGPVVHPHTECVADFSCRDRTYLTRPCAAISCIVFFQRPVSHQNTNTHNTHFRTERKMNRRTFGKLAGLATFGALNTVNELRAQESVVSGPPTRLGDEIVLEDAQLRVAFDSLSGALVRLERKSGTWVIERR